MNKIKVSRISEHLWEVLERFQSNLLPELVIPTGFRFDGSSIPNIYKMVLNNADFGVLEAGGLHDLLYGLGGWVNENLTLTRKQCDLLYLHELRLYGVGYISSAIAYRAVRMFGGSHFKQRSH
jgi:hypothetical protein